MNYLNERMPFSLINQCKTEMKTLSSTPQVGVAERQLLDAQNRNARAKQQPTTLAPPAPPSTHQLSTQARDNLYGNSNHPLYGNTNNNTSHQNTNRNQR